MRIHSPFLIPLLIPFLAAPLAAQGGGTWTLHDGVSAPLGNHLDVKSISSAGDVDGDGRADILVGIPAYWDSNQPLVGTAIVYSGANGAVIHQLSNLAADELGAAVSAVDDVDADGHADFLVGAPNHNAGSGMATLYSGATGLPIRTMQGTGTGRMGHATLGIDDFDGDGIKDMLVSEPFLPPSGNGGQVHLYSGATGLSLLTLTAPQGAHGFGVQLAAGGDLDSDGVDEILVMSAIDALTVKVEAYSLISGQPLISFYAPYWPDFLPQTALTTAGDLNQDGVDDIWVGVPRGDYFNPDDNGAIHAYSGADGSLLRVILGPAGQGNFGESIIGNVDLNRDGHPDYIVGKPKGANPKVYAYSGADDSLLGFVQGVPDTLFAMSMAAVGDTDFDGYSEIAITAPYANSSGTTRGAILLLDFDR